MIDPKHLGLARWIDVHAAEVARTAAYAAYGNDGQRAAAHFELAYRQFAHALELGEIELYLDDLRWLIRAEPAHHNESTALIGVAAESLDVLAASAPPALRDAVTATAERVRALASERRDEPVTHLLGRLAQEFFELLSHDDDRVNRFLKRALDLGISRRALYLDVLAPAQREIGLRWERGQMSDTQERERTAIVQRMLIALRRPTDGGADQRGMLAGAVAPGDAHTIGIQMVCDLAAFDGWDTVVLPAGLDHAQTLAALIATKPHVIALSAAMAAHVGNLVTLVNDIRSCGQLTGVPLIVGGSPFTRFPHLAEIIGADATADDAAEAVELFRRFAMRVAAPR